MTIFIGGKMKRVRRPPMIEGLTVDEVIRRNADPIFLHQEGLWEYLDADFASDSPAQSRMAMTRNDREPVEFITTEYGDDLVIGYAIALAEPGEIVTLILQRTPKFEMLLPLEERGVLVSHESFPDDERALAKRIVVSGLHVDIETTVRSYRVDLAGVDPEEVAAAHKVLQRMYKYGGFALESQ